MRRPAAGGPIPGQENEMMMAQVSLDELGPVDYVVVEFPAGASSFASEGGGRAAAMAASGTLRVIDVMILTKDADTTVEATELVRRQGTRRAAAVPGRARGTAGHGQRRAARGRDGPGKHGRGIHLEELEGNALRIGGGVRAAS
jgi:hypothetical protein